MSRSILVFKMKTDTLHSLFYANGVGPRDFKKHCGSFFNTIGMER